MENTKPRKELYIYMIEQYIEEVLERKTKEYKNYLEKLLERIERGSNLNIKRLQNEVRSLRADVFGSTRKFDANVCNDSKDDNV